MLILLAGEGDVACEHGILKADTAQAVLDAQQARALVNTQCDRLLAQATAAAEGIVAAAQQQAQALAQQAQQQAEQMLQLAQQSIEDAGRLAYEEGSQRAVTEWHERRAEQAELADAAVMALEARLAAIVTTAVEHIIAAKPRSALYTRALRHVQSLTRGATALTLRVNPEDQEHAREGLAPLRDGAALSCEIVADPALARGSCIFESDLGVLDAGLATQLKALRTVFERALTQPVTEEEALPVVEAPDALDEDFFFANDGEDDDSDDEYDDDEYDDEQEEDEEEDDEADHGDDDGQPERSR